MDLAQCKQFFFNARDLFEQHLDELSRLDSVLGDGDHGASMVKGFRAVVDTIGPKEYPNISALFMDAGMTFMRVVGGTCGPLFATLFTKGAAAFKDKDSLGTPEISAMFGDGNAAVQALGKSRPGDKTMVDALDETAKSLAESVETGLDLKDALPLAAKAAERGAEATKDMLATKGRGRYQGENSLGAKDAGATSVALIVEALSQSI